MNKEELSQIKSLTKVRSQGRFEQQIEVPYETRVEYQAVYYMGTRVESVLN